MSKNRIFISYSHRGNGPKWKAALLRGLHVFEQHHLLDMWQDGKIRVGSFWDDDIKQAMGNARLAVVLLTKEALESEYILKTEFPFLSDRRQSDKLPVFPVVCEDCDWRAHDWLRATQAPNESNPISLLSEDAQERIFRKLATDIAEELSRVVRADLISRSPIGGEITGTGDELDAKTYLDKFPLMRSAGLREEKLIGREQELALLDLAFAQPHTTIVSLVAWGGVGKTMLVQHWLQRLQRGGWFGARRVYAWSFYSQGTTEDRQASEDAFLAHALEWFGVQCEPTLSPWDKGRLLADAVFRERTLLILDGIEPLQYPPGPMAGQVRAPGVQSVLKQFARKVNDTEHRGLCLVTTREPLTDLADFQRRPGAVWGSMLRVDLGNLSEEAGAALLHHAGANRAGAADIKPNDTELLLASREVDGHALTLNLLGRFLARAHGGDIRRRDLVKFEAADRNEQGGTTFKMLTAFENWFANEGEIEARSLAILRLLGLFDRPADAGCMAALRKPPVFAGLTDPLFTSRIHASTSQATLQPLSDKAWNSATSFLADFDLVTIDASHHNSERSLDCHPLIREHFATQLRDKASEAWKSGHRRLYEHLKSIAEPRPSAVHGLEPLYHAVAHACQALMQQQAHDDVYFPRILRGAEHFTWHQLATFGSELSAQAFFFDEPWSQPAASLSEPTQAWILNEASFCLRALGRLVESVDPLRTSLRMNEAKGRWADAAICAGNLSELQLTLGEVNSAIWIAGRSVDFADRSQYWFFQMRNRSILGQALQAAGMNDQALRHFRDAEARQAESQPFPLLYSLMGSRYCDLILAASERAAWQRFLTPDCSIDASVIEACRHVQWRARQMFEVREPEDSLVEIAFDHLTLGRAALFESQLDDFPSTARQTAIKHVLIAVDAFYRAGQKEFECLGLLSRAWLYFLKGELAAATADLDQAWQIAERSSMRLLMADICLYRARLFRSNNDLQHARTIIDRAGYLRRKDELDDAAKAADTWIDT